MPPPYVHPRLASIEHGGKDGAPIKVEAEIIEIRLVRPKDDDVPT